MDDSVIFENGIFSSYYPDRWATT